MNSISTSTKAKLEKRENGKERINSHHPSQFDMMTAPTIRITSKLYVHWLILLFGIVRAWEMAAKIKMGALGFDMKIVCNRNDSCVKNVSIKTTNNWNIYTHYMHTDKFRLSDFSSSRCAEHSSAWIFFEAENLFIRQILIHRILKNSQNAKKRIMHMHIDFCQIESHTHTPVKISILAVKFFFIK